MLPLTHALPGALADLLRPAPLSPGKVRFAWRAAVGSALDRVTTVELVGSTLRVKAHDPHWARELRRSIPIILPRLQALLGAATVRALTVSISGATSKDSSSHA